MQREELISHFKPGQRIWRITTRLILLATVGAGVAIILMGDYGFNFIGRSAYALMVASALTNLAIISSYGADKASQNAARLMWVVLALLCLGLSEFIASQDYPEAVATSGTVMVVIIGILSAPLGLIGFLVGGFLSELLRNHQHLAGVSIWLVIIGLGYLQWFVLIPWLLYKWKVWRRRKTVTSSD